MTRVLVLYYSSYGHVEAIANAQAEGGRLRGADVVVKRVPELVPIETARTSGFKLDQAAPIAQVDELADYDAIIFGSPTRFGSVSSQMRSFLDQAGGLWAQGKLVGKVGSAFTSTATQHGGQESTILTFIPTAWWLWGCPMTFRGSRVLMKYWVARPMAPQPSAGRTAARPSAIEFEAARFQGRHVASIAERLFDQTPAMEERTWPRGAGQSR
jgi:NAD(P)H dehydrogenase (quinone)